MSIDTYNNFLKKALQSKKLVSVKIEGTCMHPLLRDGQNVSVKHVDKSDLLLGDIVLFQDEAGRLLTHRVIQLSDGFIVTAGDNNKIADLPISFDQVLGVVQIESNNYKRIPFNPNVHFLISSKYIQLIPSVMYPKIIDECKPIEAIKRYHEAGWKTVMIHIGATSRVSHLIDQLDKTVFLLGYELGEESDSENNIIGVHDVSIVCRINESCWIEENIRDEMHWLIGYCERS